MIVQYLLDTNTASYIIQDRIPAVTQRLLQIPVSLVAVSVITEAELRYGIARRPDATKLRVLVEQFLARTTVLPWDSGAAVQYASLRSLLERAGQPIGNLDLLVAAHALAANLILVTHDRAFARIPHLQLEDWVEPPSPRAPGRCRSPKLR